jgi:IS1 family transposase
MPNNSTTSWSIFPPETEEVQFDEKWDFVDKKEKHCDENQKTFLGANDARCGDNWDHVAIDAEHKLVLEVVNGKRTEENTKALVQNTAKRLKNKPPRLITSDEWRVYEKAILEAFGERHVPPPTGLPGRPRGAFYVPTEDLAL